jgi:hypothetical protein
VQFALFQRNIMDTPKREAASLAHFFKQEPDTAVAKGRTQVVLSLGDRKGTEVETGWADTMVLAIAKAEDYIRQHLPGRRL